jgi:hypothetical protein
MTFLRLHGFSVEDAKLRGVVELVSSTVSWLRPLHNEFDIRKEVTMLCSIIAKICTFDVNVVKSGRIGCFGASSVSNIEIGALIQILCVCWNVKVAA